ncbi:MAG: hypothetical protein H6812_10440 [Phycisphaeraceae bacterium]|nr:hypothetical protein [Phycisphaerales bacterium]MCB9843665.1 hypothetical protein [Phycisphaeraceae bacterium]
MLSSRPASFVNAHQGERPDINQVMLLRKGVVSEPRPFTQPPARLGEQVGQFGHI